MNITVIFSKILRQLDLMAHFMFAVLSLMLKRLSSRLSKPKDSMILSRQTEVLKSVMFTKLSNERCESIELPVLCNELEGKSNE